jgi:hypothetical protein
MSKARTHPKTGEPTNEQRAEWGILALDAFARETYHHRTFAQIEKEMAGIENGDDYTCVQDLICDLLHVAHIRGWKIDRLLEAVRSNFDIEIQQEEDATK